MVGRGNGYPKSKYSHEQKLSNIVTFSEKLYPKPNCCLTTKNYYLFNIFGTALCVLEPNPFTLQTSDQQIISVHIIVYHCTTSRLKTAKAQFNDLGMKLVGLATTLCWVDLRLVHRVRVRRSGGFSRPSRVGRPLVGRFSGRW